EPVKSRCCRGVPSLRSGQAHRRRSSISQSSMSRIDDEHIAASEAQVSWGARHRSSFAVAQTALVLALSLTSWSDAHSKTPASDLKFEISCLPLVHAQPGTGRVFVVIARKSDPEPRLQAGSWEDPPPLFGVDVDRLKPGEAAVIDARTLGYPLSSLKA